MFSDIFPKRLGDFSPYFTRLLDIPVYARLHYFLFNYLQLWGSYVMLSATSQFTICLKCPTSAETHAGWSN